MQKHLLIIDPIECLNLKLDSSLRMGLELSNQGCEVFYCEISMLFWNKSSKYASCTCFKIDYKKGIENLSFSEKTDLCLSNFKSIQMRKEPPFDTDFISATWFLDAVPNSTLVVNSPRTLREVNEKLSIFFSPETSDKALVSSDPSKLMDFIKNECDFDGIIKPLNLFGGRGVFRINLKEKSEKHWINILEQETRNGQFRLIQPFNHKIFDGEVRVFSLNGEPLSWCLKKPKDGEYLANTSAGAKLLPYSPSKALEEKIAKVSKKLCQDYGAYFLGFDVIGEVISEINVTSPRLLQSSEDQRNYYAEIAAWLVEF